MAGKRGAAKPTLSEERAAEIKADAESASYWAGLVNYGPACVCGLRGWDGPCERHPVQK
jgi:hypothetical protein